MKLDNTMQTAHLYYTYNYNRLLRNHVPSGYRRSNSLRLHHLAINRSGFCHVWRYLTIEIL